MAWQVSHESLQALTEPHQQSLVSLKDASGAGQRKSGAGHLGVEEERLCVRLRARLELTESAHAANGLPGSESQPDANKEPTRGATTPEASLLLRLVDDFLLITFCPTTAEAMAACLLKGKPHMRHDALDPRAQGLLMIFRVCKGHKVASSSLYGQFDSSRAAVMISALAAISFK